MLAGGTLLVAGCLVLFLMRSHNRDLAEASRTQQLMDTVLRTSREWLWIVGQDGRFTFSGPMGRELLGYDPSELLGKHISHVIDADDLAQAQRDRQKIEGPCSSWSGLVTVCRHRDGRRVLVEVSGRPVLDGRGQVCGFEGTTRALNQRTADTVAAEEARASVEAMLSSRTLLTAFQPIRALDTGAAIGAEALTRFLSAEGHGISPEAWFVEAASVGLGGDLEMLALRSALSAAASLPPHLYVAVNLSPGACLDDRATHILLGCGLPLGRVVLELTERHEVTDYARLAAALAPLRAAGLRIAVDDAGAGFASMRHVVELKPELIKLDREIIAGINADAGLRALGAAMVGFARELGASLVAEGVETEAELATVRMLGMSAAQGYLLGRPTVASEQWNLWTGPTGGTGPTFHPSGRQKKHEHP